MRCFVDDDIIHVDGTVDPARDIEVINLELILADISQIEKRLEKVRIMTFIIVSIHYNLDCVCMYDRYGYVYIPYLSLIYKVDRVYAHICKYIIYIYIYIYIYVCV